MGSSNEMGVHGSGRGGSTLRRRARSGSDLSYHSLISPAFIFQRFSSSSIGNTFATRCSRDTVSRLPADDEGCVTTPFDKTDWTLFITSLLHLQL
ncbi:hypothetical protein J6590_003151 [Homalodisca vitripennis]|nr:hypothetical protein J6590_003151 [Homalodisca vitripennis]